MFQLTYTFRELRRRLGRTILTAFGLAAGVGLVIGIIGISDGLNQAQANVLAPLSSVGTDILVTRVAGSTTTAAAASASPSPTPSGLPGGGPGGRGQGQGFFGGGPGGGNADVLNSADAAALLNENSNVVTDLSKLGKPGTKFTHDFFLSATLLSFPDTAIAQIRSLAGVTSAVGALTQLAEHQTGTVPEIVANVQTGGETVTTTVRPAPMTDAERQAVQACLQKNGFTAGPGGDGGGRRGGDGAFEKCLPARFQQYQASVVTPLRTIRQVVDPPSTDITNTTYTAAGIEASNKTVGLVTVQQLTSGAWLSTTATSEVLASVAYANKHTLTVGSTITINGTSYTVVGLVSPTLTGSTADLYFPLKTLQTLATKPGRITQVLVKASSAAKVDDVAAAIKKALPGAEVVTTRSLADQVTGSLADARNLASRLGGALGVIVLLAAFAIAMLLTLSSVAKRVREIGTLRAIGWSKGRVVRQMVSETLGIGLLGGILGVAIGFAVSAGVGLVSPPLSATSTGIPGLASSSLASFFGSAGQASTQTSTVALRAPVRLTAMALGIAFALVGGLLAGAVGGWRASRLSPAEALRNIG